MIRRRAGDAASFNSSQQDSNVKIQLDGSSHSIHSRASVVYSPGVVAQWIASSMMAMISAISGEGAKGSASQSSAIRKWVWSIRAFAFHASRIDQGMWYALASWAHRHEARPSTLKADRFYTDNKRGSPLHRRGATCPRFVGLRFSMSVWRKPYTRYDCNWNTGNFSLYPPFCYAALLDRPTVALQSLAL